MADESKTITIVFRGEDAQLNNTVSNIDKMIKVLKNDTSLLQKEMKFGATGSEYEKQMKLYDQAISNVSQSLELAKTNQAHWNDEITKYQDKMASGQALSEQELNYLLTAQKQYSDYGKQIENLTEQLKRLRQEQENYNRLSVAANLQEQGQAFQSLGRSVNQVANAFRYVSLAASGALTGAVASAVSFESAMADVNKVLRQEEKDYLGTLQQQILDMSRELPLTAKEIAEVTANALQLGISAKDVGLFTETILKLGSATNIASEEAGIAIAQLFNITGESFSNVDKFGASLTDLGNKFPTFESDIMNMATRLGAAGASVKMTSQDILALATALSSTGLAAEGGGSAVSQIIRKIDKEVALNSSHLKQWAKYAGMSVAEFRNAWSTDAMGAFQTLIDNLKKATDSGTNLNVVMADLGIGYIRQIDAFARLVNASDVLDAALISSAEAWGEVEEGEEGALNVEFEKRVQTLAAQFQLLKNDLFNLGVMIGQELMPHLLKLIDFARSIVDWFINLSPTTKKWITGFLIGLASIYPILKTIGTVLLSIGMLLTGIGGVLANPVAKTFITEKMFGGILGFINTMKGLAATLAGPLAVLAALAAVFVLLYKNNEEFRNGIDRLTAAFKFGIIRETQELMNFLKDFGAWFESKFKPFFDYLVQLYHTFIEPSLAYLFSALTKLIYNGLLILYDIVVKVIKYLINIAKPVIDVILKLIQAFATFLAPVIGLVITLVGVIAELTTWLAQKLKPAIDETIEILGNIFQAFFEVAGIIGGALVDAIQWLIEKFAELFGFLKDTKVINSFKTAFEGVVGIVKSAVEWFSKLWDKFKAWRKDTFSVDEIANSWSDGSYRVSPTGVITINNNQRNTFNTTNALESATQQAADGMVDLINNAIGKQLNSRGW